MLCIYYYSPNADTRKIANKCHLFRRIFMEQKKLYCHFCGIERENPQQSKCSRCGALFVETCSRCGEPVKKGRDNCIKCGLSIDKMIVPPPGMRVVSESEIIRRKLPRDERVQKKKIPVWARNVITAVLIVTAIFIVNIVYENFKCKSREFFGQRSHGGRMG